MPESYAQSAVRHFDDANRLAEADALHGAGYLIGYSAECAIKAAVARVRSRAEVPQVHLPALIEKSRKMLAGRVHQALFAALKSPDLMAGWSTALRYEENNAVSQPIFQTWKRDAGRILAAAGIKRGKT